MTEQTEEIVWDEDPLCFIFHNEVPGKVKMHTKRLDWEDWIKIDNTYPAQMKLRQQLLDSTRETVFVSNDDESVAEAKQELLEKIIEYLPTRFPDKFERRQGGIFNKILKEFVSDASSDAEDPLIRAGRLTAEDWVILQWDEAEEAFKLTAGIVFFPMRWSLTEKWNKDMAGIHQPVQSFEKHLSKNVASLFKAMSPQSPVWRANWAVFNDLYGPLDLYSPAGHLDRKETNQVTSYEGELTGTKLTFRAEYQTICKLPASRALVFSIRTYQRFLSDFRKFPLEDSLGLIRAIETLEPDFYVYKGAEFWREAAVRYLEDIVLQRERTSRVKTLLCTTLLAGLVLVLGYSLTNRR